MNDSDDIDGTRHECPFCAQPIQDLEKINLSLIQAVILSEVLPQYVHDVRNPLVALSVRFWSMRQTQKSDYNKETAEAIDSAFKALDRLAAEINAMWKWAMPALYRMDDDSDLTESDIRELHSFLDKTFAFPCEFRESGLKGRQLEVNRSMYRYLMYMIHVRSLSVVGAQQRPEILIQYLAEELCVVGEVRVRNCAAVEVDKAKLTLATILARRIGLDLQIKDDATDKLFTWKIPVRIDR